MDRKEIFLNRISVKLPDFKIVGEYINQSTRVIVEDKFGNQFSVYPQSLERGVSPSIQTAVDKKSYYSFLARLIHGDRYDYSKISYTNAQSKEAIVCPNHGVFYQRLNDHLKGCGCSKCSVESRAKQATKTTKEFIDESKLVHGDRYDYSKSIYTKSSSDIIIRCKKHGDFKQSPNSHLMGKNCSKCSIEKVSNRQRSNLDEFINKALEIHGSKYSYLKSKYRSSASKIKITCPIHGDFLQTPSSHLTGSGCGKCARKKSSDSHRYSTVDFVAKAKIIHGNFYDYNSVIYIDSKSPVDIKCPIHGEFSQIANSHLLGHGCSKCNSGIGYSKSSWVNFCEKNNRNVCSVYIIKCFNNEESFVKIGMTSTSVEHRFSNDKRFMYSFEIIKEIKGSPDFIWDKEKDLHDKYLHMKYIPKLKFGGYTECFTTEILELL